MQPRWSSVAAGRAFRITLLTPTPQLAPIRWRPTRMKMKWNWCLAAGPALAGSMLSRTHRRISSLENLIEKTATGCSHLSIAKLKVQVPSRTAHWKTIPFWQRTKSSTRESSKYFWPTFKQIILGRLIFIRGRLSTHPSRSRKCSPLKDTAECSGQESSTQKEIISIGSKMI